MADWCDGPLCVLWISALAAIIIASSIMLGLSFSIVKEDEYGLRFNMATGKFSDEVDEMGRHFVSLGRFHVTFPRRYTTINFLNGGDFPPSSVWSNTGQNIYTDISFDIRLVKEKLHSFYYEFGKNWKPFIMRIAYSRIKDVTTGFSTQPFFEARSTIQQAMFNKVSTDLSTLTNGSIEVMNLQLREISLEPSYENTIEDKLIEEQNNDILATNKTIAEINKDIEIVYSNASNSIREAQAAIRSQAAETRGKGWGDYVADVYGNEITLFTDNMKTLMQKPKDSFISYIYLCYLRRLDGSTKLNMGIDAPSFTNFVS